jgi:hypothetical protein
MGSQRLRTGDNAIGTVHDAPPARKVDKIGIRSWVDISRTQRHFPQLMRSVTQRQPGIANGSGGERLEKRSGKSSRKIEQSPHHDGTPVRALDK